MVNSRWHSPSKITQDMYSFQCHQASNDKVFASLGNIKLIFPGHFYVVQAIPLSFYEPLLHIALLGIIILC